MIEIEKPAPPIVNAPVVYAATIPFTNGGHKPFEMIYNLDSIKDNIRNILFFRKYDYLDNPDFGLGLQDYVFENYEQSVMEIALSQEIRRQINTYEPRARVVSVKVFSPAWLDNGIVIDLVLSVNGLNFKVNATSLGNFQVN